MDSLKPLLTHKFWVMFVAALILAVGGYWITAGGQEAAFTAARGKLEASFTDADSLKSKAESSDAPNEQWQAGIEAANRRMDQQYKNQVAELYRRQKSRMIWPVEIHQQLKDLEYRETIPRTPYPSQFRSDYPVALVRLRQIVNPWDSEAKREKLVVILDLETLPQHRTIIEKTAPPTSKEMWDAEEDIWLTEAILKAIRQVNGPAEFIGDAKIRAIEELRLMGGYRLPPSQQVPGAAGQPGGPASLPADPTLSGAGGLRGLPSRSPLGRKNDSRNRRSQVGYSQADFDPIREFGDPSFIVPTMGTAPGGVDPSLMAGPQSPLGQEAGRRYVEDEELPYRTRGFYLKVVMDQGFVPDLVANLANMEWPTQIVRVHQVAANPAGHFPADEFRLGSEPQVARSGGGASSRGAVSRGAEGRPAGGLARMTGVGDEGLTDALEDPMLAEVVIAGMMTIYKAPSTDGSSVIEEETEPPAIVDPPASLEAPVGGPDPATPAADESGINDEKPEQDAPGGDSGAVIPESGIENRNPGVPNEN